MFNNNGVDIDNQGASGVVISHNLCQASAVGCSVVGDPKIVNASATPPDFHLQSGSPAINAGTNAPSSIFTTDFDGLSRPQPPSANWAIGAFEYKPGTSYSPCDVNRDNVTNVSDVQLDVNAALGVIPCTSVYDINQDSVCNVIDVQRVVNAALGGTCVTP